jgi:hypothetical protein
VVANANYGRSGVPTASAEALAAGILERLLALKGEATSSPDRGSRRPVTVDLLVDEVLRPKREDGTERDR